MELIASLPSSSSPPAILRSSRLMEANKDIKRRPNGGHRPSAAAAVSLSPFFPFCFLLLSPFSPVIRRCNFVVAVLLLMLLPMCPPFRSSLVFDARERQGFWSWAGGGFSSFRNYTTNGALMLLSPSPRVKLPPSFSTVQTTYSAKTL